MKYIEDILLLCHMITKLK